MKRKIFGSMFLLCLLTALLSFSLVLWTDYNTQRERLHSETARQATGIAAACAVTEDLDGLLTALSDFRLRITLVSRDGSVLFDSQSDPALMDNHQDRPEIEQAFSTGTGQRTRLSDTLGDECYYYALRLDTDTVLRVAACSSSIWASTRRHLPRFIAASGVLCLFSLFFASRVTRRLLQPLGRLDLDHPLDNDTYEELSPLLARIHYQNENLRLRMETLTRQREQLSAITASMTEGLIVLDDRLSVLSCNASALHLLGCSGLSPARQNLVVLCREAWMTDLARSALGGRRAERVETLHERALRVLASPASNGCILLLSDVTEQQENERMRREFTANVSHELKTPLTSISGYAELIESGMARQEDVPRFAGIISSECARLLALVDDIISLSRLDEGAVPQADGPVGLLSLAHEAASRVRESAEKRGITLRVEGQEQTLCASRPALLELICNLCDNAVKYNHDGGAVTVSVYSDDGSPCLSVADTGIGIPKEEQSRIFERFYRVDKSRSRDVGGTGLGLAIVKHLAQTCGARVAVDSEPGRGSTFTVRFSAPKPG